MIRFVFLFVWIFPIIVQGYNYMTWMGDHSSLLSSKTLGNISLPATHDSGTYNLTDYFINLDSYGPPLTILYNSLVTVANKTGEPLNHLVDLFAAGVRALSQCTTQNISIQLKMGNRALDLRLSVYNGDIYLAHGLQGPPLSDVLTQVSKFLNATNGEIVFMTLGHPYGFNQTYINRLASLLNPFLLDGTAITPAAYPGDLLNYKYRELVPNGSSRVIIVVNDTINPDSNSFFAASVYSPPDGGSDKLYSCYADSDNITIVTENQTNCYANARAASAPVSISTVLTPSYADTVSIIINTIVADFSPLTQPFVLAIFKAYLAIYNMSNLYNNYVSLYDIYARQGVIANRANIVRSIQPVTNASRICILYTDFYENDTHIIDLAIQYSTTI